MSSGTLVKGGMVVGSGMGTSLRKAITTTPVMEGEALQPAVCPQEELHQEDSDMVVEEETSMDLGGGDTTMTASAPKKLTGAFSPMQIGDGSSWLQSSAPEDSDGEALFGREFTNPNPVGNLDENMENELLDKEEGPLPTTFSDDSVTI